MPEGTSGYTIKEGKNTSKILKHLKKIQRQFNFCRGNVSQHCLYKLAKILIYYSSFYLTQSEHVDQFNIHNLPLICCVSLKYKKNNFSTETVSTLQTESQYNIYKNTKPKIDHLIKRINDERKREKRNVITVGTVFLSTILTFYFFQQ